MSGCDYCDEGLPKEDPVPSREPPGGWHLRVDPDGYEPTQRIPCQQALQSTWTLAERDEWFAACKRSTEAKYRARAVRAVAAEAEVARLRHACDYAIHELGVPQDELTPAPVANAYRVLVAALAPTEWFDGPSEVSDPIRVNKDGTIEGFALPFPPHCPDTEAYCTCAATYIPEESTPDLRVYRHLGHEAINPTCPIHGVTPERTQDLEKEVARLRGRYDEAVAHLYGIVEADKQDAQMGHPNPGDSCIGIYIGLVLMEWLETRAALGKADA